MKKTIIIVAIAVLCIVALCLGVLIALTPDPVQEVVENIPVENSLTEILDIQRPNTKVKRLFAIRTYQDGLDTDDILKIAQVGGLEYYELSERSKDYLLITPFEIEGKMEISTLVYDTYNEEYVPDQVVFRCNSGKELPDNYSLLLKYSRPSEPRYQIKLTQGEQTATYQIINTENGSPVRRTQLVKDDIDGGGTESVGNEIRIYEDGEEN